MQDIKQETEMVKWFVDQLSRRRLNDEIIRCAELALPQLIARIPANQTIDAQDLFEQALIIGATMANGFDEEGLL